MLAGIGDVAATSFLTLYCHALETLSDNPILSDPRSVEITAGLNKTLSRSDHTLDRILVAGTLDKSLVVHMQSVQKNTMTMHGISYRGFRTALLSISAAGPIYGCCERSE